MTNQLFRDYLDGKGVKPAAFDHRSFNRAVTDVAKVSGWTYQYAADVLIKFAKELPNIGLTRVAIYNDWNTDTAPPTADPRERALWAKQQRSHGPTQDDLTTRGRVTKYRTKR